VFSLFFLFTCSCNLWLFSDIGVLCWWDYNKGYMLTNQIPCENESSKILWSIGNHHTHIMQSNDSSSNFLSFYCDVLDWSFAHECVKIVYLIFSLVLLLISERCFNRNRHCGNGILWATTKAMGLLTWNWDLARVGFHWLVHYWSTIIESIANKRLSLAQYTCI